MVLAASAPGHGAVRAACALPRCGRRTAPADPAVGSGGEQHSSRPRTSSNDSNRPAMEDSSVPRTRRRSIRPVGAPAPRGGQCPTGGAHGVIPGGRPGRPMGGHQHEPGSGQPRDGGTRQIGGLRSSDGRVLDVFGVFGVRRYDRRFRTCDRQGHQDVPTRTDTRQRQVVDDQVAVSANWLVSKSWLMWPPSSDQWCRRVRRRRGRHRRRRRR